ncbi:MAG: GPI-anchor transamidase [Amphiamblys sp. WSBS2006]|nr:MAG: GPI-anchor transamidase [Amphiamblys sp. WSBS2006]
MRVFPVLLGSFVAADNWAVLIATSTGWSNYRHGANVLSVYQNIRRLGIPDRNIIVMLAEDFDANRRNILQDRIYCEPTCKNNINADSTVDYKNEETTAESVFSVLTDTDPTAPDCRRLRTDENSRILVYVTGHGVESFINIGSEGDVGASDFSNIFSAMHAAKRYKEILFIADTCQAYSLFEEITAPGIIAISSSDTTKPSLSSHINRRVGSHASDELTYLLYLYLSRLDKESPATLGGLWEEIQSAGFESCPRLYTTDGTRALSRIRATDFFGKQSDRAPV